MKKLFFVFLSVSIALTINAQIGDNIDDYQYNQILTLAEQGNAYGQYELGLMYARGLRLKKDEKKAFELMMKSANQGYPAAQLILGIYYYEGELVEKDLNKAFKLIKKSVEQSNDETGLYMLGVLYFNGEGTEVDKKQAASYIKKAKFYGSWIAEEFWDENELWKYE